MGIRGVAQMATAVCLSVLLFGACSSDPGESDLSVPAATNQTPAPPVTTPAPDESIPVVDADRDELVYQRLVEWGFSEAEADCVSRMLTLETMTNSSAEDLVDVYTGCNIEITRLIELGGAGEPAPPSITDE